MRPFNPIHSMPPNWSTAPPWLPLLFYLLEFFNVYTKKYKYAYSFSSSIFMQKKLAFIHTVLLVLLNNKSWNLFMLVHREWFHSFLKLYSMSLYRCTINNICAASIDGLLLFSSLLLLKTPPKWIKLCICHLLCKYICKIDNHKWNFWVSRYIHL